MEVEGTFDAERFFKTLAMILSDREKAEITVSVKRPDAEDGQSGKRRETA